MKISSHWSCNFQKNLVNIFSFLSECKASIAAVLILKGSTMFNMIKIDGCSRNTKASPFQSMAPEEVAKYLSTENEAVIEELYKMMVSLYSSESDRLKSIDAKSSTLFGFVGAMISAIFVVLSFLGDPKNVKLISILSGKTFYFLSATLIFLVFALMALFRSVAVRSSLRAPGEKDLFEAIHKYDGHIANDPKNNEKSAHNYRRHLIEHFWKLYRVHFEQNEAKARALLWGQRLLFFAMLLLVAIQFKAVIGFAETMTNPNQNPDISSTPQAPQAASTNDGRPAPLPVSTEGAPMRNGLEGRPEPLAPSSQGMAMREGAGSQPLKASGGGQTVRLTEGSLPKVTGGRNGK